MSRFEARAAALVPAAVFVPALLLYVSRRSLFFNFDGVACAMAVELSDFKHLVHGNHLAYGVLAWLFDRTWRLLGYAGPALLPLQAMSALLGAAAAAVFSSLLLRSGRTPREAWLGGAALAVSHAWWFWSLEAQVYMLGAFFIALAAREALSDAPRPRLVGLWHAAAILGHVGHVMAAPALLWALARSGGRKAALRHVLSVALILGIAYSAAALAAVRPSSLEDWRLWLLGSAALGEARAFQWHSVPIAESVASWGRLTLEIFWKDGAGPAPALLPLLAAVSGLLRRGVVSRFWGLWLAGYAALFLTWEPGTIVYRVTDLLALWALAFEGAAPWPPRARALALTAWCLAAGAHNWRSAVLPASAPENNLDLMEARWAGSNTPQNAWVLAVNRGEAYIPYFAGRKPLNARYWRKEEQLVERLDALARSAEPAYATERSLAASGWKDAFERYGLKPVAGEGDLRLYRVARRKSRLR